MKKVVVIKDIWHLMSSTPLFKRVGEVIKEDNHNLSIKFDCKLNERYQRCFDVPKNAVISLEEFPIYQSAVAKLTAEERKVLGIYWK